MIDVEALTLPQLMALAVQLAATIAAREAADRLKCSVTVAAGTDDGEPYLMIGVRLPDPSGSRTPDTPRGSMK